MTAAVPTAEESAVLRAVDRLEDASNAVIEATGKLGESGIAGMLPALAALTSLNCIRLGDAESLFQLRELLLEIEKYHGLLRKEGK